MRVKPKAWGVHNYEDINHFRTTGTDAILKATKGKIWLTEAAGLVRYVDGDANIIYPFDEDFAARATDYLFDYVEAHPERITRVYYYAWRNRSPIDDYFDTALLRRDGSTRPSYDIVAARLAKLLPGVASAPPIQTLRGRKAQPLELLDRRLRIVRGGLMAGPLRCAPARGSRCSGRLELRWSGAAPGVRHPAILARGSQDGDLQDPRRPTHASPAGAPTTRAAGSRSCCVWRGRAGSRAYIRACRSSCLADEPGRRPSPRTHHRCAVRRVRGLGGAAGPEPLPASGGGGDRAVQRQQRRARDADGLREVDGRGGGAFRRAGAGQRDVLHRADQGARVREVLRALHDLRGGATSGC